ncbi:MAG: LemA family protein [Rhodomicrobium sp.]
MPTRLSSRLIAFIAVLASALFLSGCGINTIPTLEQDAKAKWSEVLNQYKRRADLIPNLVESVRGFADQEKSVLVGVTEARAKATQVQVSLPPDILTNPDAMKKFGEAQGQLSSALGRLLAVSEKYPDIKSGANFMALQNQIEGTENRIAIARRDYIQAVQQYNTELNTFPGRIWKSILYSSAKDMATFDITPQETQVPKVDFGPRKPQ